MDKIDDLRQKLELQAANFFGSYRSPEKVISTFHGNDNHVNKVSIAKKQEVLEQYERSNKFKNGDIDNLDLEIYYKKTSKPFYRVSENAKELESSIIDIQSSSSIDQMYAEFFGDDIKTQRSR